MKSKIRKISCMCLTAVMASTFIAGNVLALANNLPKAEAEAVKYDTVDFEKATGKVDLTGIGLQNLNSSVLEDNAAASNVKLSKNETYTVIVTLEQQSVVDGKPQSQSVPEYLKTFTGDRALDAIEKSQDAFLYEVRRAGVRYEYVGGLGIINNAVAIRIKGSDISKVRKLTGVKSVVLSSTYARPQEADDSAEKASAVTNPNDVYGTGIYNSQKFVEQGLDGSGVTIAILDTGLDYTHDAFSINMPETTAFSFDYVQKRMSGETPLQSQRLSAEKGTALTAENVYINAKVPYAYDYADKDPDVYPSYSQHGTHVAGISAGNSPYGYTDKKGNTVDELFTGVAPNAQLVICKVFTDDLDSSDLGGASSEDILAALDDCVALGVDVINMSLGTSSGFSSVSIEGDTEGKLFNDTYNKIKDEGISLICAASNDFSSGYGSVFGTNLASNPDSGTVGSPSTFDGALSVASINGQSSRYFTVAGGGSYSSAEPVFYTDSSDANYQRNDFLEQMIGTAEGSHTFRYVVINGNGQASDYSSAIRNYLNVKSEEYPNGLKQEGEKVIAVIKRGSNSFQQKVEIAMRAGADAVIIYNNVAGSISMSLGDIDNPVPAVSVTMDAGAILTSIPRTGSVQVGTITLNAEYQAGPFMNDYSSWGATPDLKLKPEITSYGGEITSTVAGGYDEMSGTSMATPNLAGFTALLRSYLKDKGYEGTELTKLINNIMMSTATTVYNEEGLPYSPRKQGAGLATLDNVFNTKAYLYTDEDLTEDGRPKIELGEDEGKEGVYNLKFYVKNFDGAANLTFTAKSIFMTETLSSDGLSVAEKAHLFTDEKSVWRVDGKELAEGEPFTVNAGATATIEVTLKLSKAEKEYIDSRFVNGMYVEGFLKLESSTDGQCGLNLPFMGFYGDWQAAPMLDYDCYEIAEFEQDSSFTDETRPQAQVWATQAYASYYDGRYVIPMGNYVYVQDENAEQIYTNIEYSAVSCFNEIINEEGSGNHATTYRIKSLYAGLLRNAELVTYDMYNTDTGEIVISDNVYRVNKAYAGGGSATPAQVLLELRPDELGLIENGRYAMEFHFYMDADDRENTTENTFSMIFYVDYEAPVLEKTSIRYYDYKENNITKQRVYLDIDIYDNHYAQAVMLCYPHENGKDIILATEYITPVYNPTKNGTTTVTIEVTDLIAEHQQFYLQIVDYALNYNVYSMSFSASQQTLLPDSFRLADDPNITYENGEYQLTIGLNETYTIKLDYEGNANLSNFMWQSARDLYVPVKNGEVFGARVGSSVITVTGKNGANLKIRVNVVNGSATLDSPTISFGTIKNADEGLQKATGTVEVNAGSEFRLSVMLEPWYYPTNGLRYVWTSSNENIATVDSDGNVKVFDTKGSATIRARLYDANDSLMSATSVTLSVQDPFTVTGSTLTAYHGTGGDIVLPIDKNIMSIAEDAFKENNNITSIVFPSTLRQINARAFARCTELKAIYFVSKDKLDKADADLSLIMSNAFADCKKLETVDLSNVKIITLDRGVFSGCTSLREVKSMEKIGTMNRGAFEGCTSLRSADITGLHTAGANVFKGCTSLQNVQTDYYTAIGANMFEGCSSLTSVTINTPNVSSYAFFKCVSLETVEFGAPDSGLIFSIGEYAFNECINLKSVKFNGNKVSRMGDMAFAGCSNLAAFDCDFEGITLGDQVFAGTKVVFDTAVYDGTKLLLAPKTITADFAIRAGTTEIAPYAFSSSVLEGVTTIVIPDTVTKIGEGAFAHLTLTSINIPSSITEIPDYAFYGNERLLSVTVPSSVTSIGVSAFEGCSAITAFTFANGSNLESIGDNAFKNCQGLERIALPDGCANMGGYVFDGCIKLVEAVLPSLSNLGVYTFRGCTALESVTFGTNAATAGSFTFVACSKLASVTLGEKTRELGMGVFNGCTALTSIDLKNVTAIGALAFTGDTALTSVTGLDKVEIFGEEAFAGCTGLNNLTLTAAKIIGDGAFYNVGFNNLALSEVLSIGQLAFYGGNASAVTIPSTLVYLGDGAFAHSPNLKEINIGEGEGTYFSVDGVVYRNVTDVKTGETFYELAAYPASKTSSSYKIIEGTILIQGYAFAEMNGLGFLRHVTLPYSVKAIGAQAFYMSGILTYEFECVEAPVLYAEYYDNGFNSLHGATFEDEFILHTKDMGLISSYPDIEPAQLKIIYPENGTGYDNFIYSRYFSEKEISAEIMDNVTRALKKVIEGFRTAAEVSEWNSLAVNDENRKTVQAFSDEVKAAHAQYNNITSEKQLEFLGSANVEKLFAIEASLKPVKARFGIPVVVSALEVSADSAHKTQYKAGDTFDMTGLKIDVTYDDYSFETISYPSDRMVLNTTDPLTTLNRYVRVYIDGMQVQVAVTVTEEGGSEKPEPPKPQPSGVNPAVIYGPIIGVVVLAGIAVAVIFVLKKKKTVKPTEENVGNSGENKED